MASMAAAAASTSDHPVAASSAVDLSRSENLQNESPDSNNGPDSQIDKSTPNSHQHESEYDTASDLEDGEDEYDDDDDDDDDDESLGVSGDDDEESDDNSTDLDAERQRGDGQEQIDYTTKVDEDRRNPQYIPKKGFFYEHDDRTADEPGPTDNLTEDGSEAGGDGTKSSTPTISTASKTMKKWQPASGGDRWSHDRFDESEQAPKSRTELVSAYGYDIRNEDGPPRARRRRRYARGPTKYERKWEDEDAYNPKAAIIAARKQPPRPEDFPALGDRKTSRSFREEKENRYDRQNERPNNHRQSGQNFRDRDNNRRSGGGKGFRGGRHQSMEFKNKNRNNDGGNRMQNNRNFNDRDSREYNHRQHEAKGQVESVSFTNTKVVPNNVTNQSQQTSYNGHEVSQQQQQQQNYQLQQIPGGGGGGGYRDLNDKMNVINVNLMNQQQSQPRQHQQQSTQNSHLTSRLQQVQQVQNRNDPSHVGSIQMHSLAAQSQVGQVQQQQHQQQQQQQQQTMLQVAQNSVQNVIDLGQEQGRPKRYSSIRQRSQNEQQLDPHSLQQLQLQHDAQQTAAAVAAAAVAAHQQPQQQQQQQQQLQLHLQANLMQLYQENLHHQSTATAAALQAKPQQYPAVVQSQYQTVVPSAAQPTAYFAASPNDYTVTPVAAAVSPQQQQQQYSQPPPQTAYLQQPPPPQMQPQPAASPIAYSSPPPVALSQQQSAGVVTQTGQPLPAASVPNSLNYVQTTTQNPTSTGGAGAVGAAAASYPNYPSYQNFNTVGGTTYFVSQPQPQQRPVVLQQRRPTNAIPILPPSDKSKQRSQDKDDDRIMTSSNSSMTTSASSSNAPIGSAENIDHILDNMFVQRPAYQPPTTRKSASPSNDGAGLDAPTNDESRIEDAVKNLSISDDTNTSSAVPETTKTLDDTVQQQQSQTSSVTAVIGDQPPNETD